ncbi:hypothetical protein [Occultella gossypii]|uniref:AAA family ATPase n=1 Tax=Occultella gossypii TaxID=2800820 RepID=A0ABS7SBW2_9MICO|nr:hypothetical protein [Occultella gossypii]MBZ2197368.1 AAA family ATPase [Occultella gossypii]
MSFDTGCAALVALKQRESASEWLGTRNEAQTRFDVIDHMLSAVLDWPSESITVEQYAADGYTDYELREIGTIAIVEAKKEGAAFVLPMDTKSGTCGIRALIGDRSNASLKSAMEQVMRYAGSRGVAPCVVTNGHQWVAFLGSRNDGVAPLDGKALVYPSLEAIEEHFVTFYNCLSYDGLRAKRIFSQLSTGTHAPPPPLSSALTSYPGVKRRNNMQTNLQIMGEVMLEDMPQEEKYSDLFLERCYATSGALSSYAEISRELLTSRTAAVLGERGQLEEPASLKKGVNPVLSEEALSAAASHRPIVLLGGVGVGKSTFIQHLVRIDAKPVFQDAIAVTVDYGRGATFSSPAEYAVERIRETLLEDFDIDIDDAAFVEDLYRKDIERFDRGVDGQLKDVDSQAYLLRRIDFLRGLIGNKSDHLRRAINRIVRSHHRQVVIFLDNVDQRDHDVQNLVFLAANELAASWDATVFVTLRPETYYESQRYGAVSGYHPRVFAISPPRTDVMLQKRVDFALQVLEGGGDVRTNGGGLTLASENLELFLRVLEGNFRRNRELLALIDNLAGGNMRRALSFVTQFVGSGHVDTVKIVEVEKRNPGDYFIPIHEFLRSLMYGDNEYYDPQTSPIANMFAVDRPERRNHFLLPLALAYVLSRGDAKDSAGYIEVSDVYSHLQGQGFDLEAVSFALNYLARFRLIEAPLTDFNAAHAERARITMVGAYTLNKLIPLFTYCDAVVVDVPIIDTSVRPRIASAYFIGERLARARAFQVYLDEAWAESGLDESGWSWPAVSAELGRDIGKIEVRTSSAS